MVRHLRRDWAETGGMPWADAHRRHVELAREGNFTGASGEGIAAHRDDVIARARAQRPN
jgi:hypothetical protein